MSKTLPEKYLLDVVQFIQHPALLNDHYTGIFIEQISKGLIEFTLKARSRIPWTTPRKP
jgi:hypothetical protein